MPKEFQLDIPTGQAQTNVSLRIGDTLYLLGANGTGKSGLVSHLFRQHQAHAKRISAHRQTWFESNTLEITARARQDLENTFRGQDAESRGRYWEWNPSARSNSAIYDLVDADAAQARKIAALVRSHDLPAADREAQSPSPIQVINELMRLSNLPIEISLEEGQSIIARKNRGDGYSVAELSDGERNAFLIATNVLTARAETLILIDEPERHLHRSIISPLLKLLFDRRKDCAFIVSTHELMLPIDTAEALTLLVRGCEFAGREPRSWTVDLVPPGAAIGEDLKRDVLGARRRMLFVEGTTRSLDAPLYNLLFPQVSVIPKEGCREVEYAVKGLRSAAEMHWVAAWGLVDNDRRSPQDIERLKEAGIWALPHYSVESFYYHPTIVSRIAARQAQLIGVNAETLVKSAFEKAIAAARAQRDHFVTGAVLRASREKILNGLPGRDDAARGGVVKVEVDMSALRAVEGARFDALANAEDWNGLLARYPLRESSAFDRVISELKIADQATYRAAVLKLLQDDPAAVMDLRNLLGDLCAAVTA